MVSASYGPKRNLMSNQPAFSHRLTLAILFLSAITLLVLEKSGNDQIKDIRRNATDVIAPALDTLSRPVEGVKDMVDYVKEVVFVFEENRQLRSENERLKSWVATAEALAHENRRLRALLGVKSQDVIQLVTPRVIGDTGGAFSKALILNAGTGDGVREGLAVIDESGLIGHIIEAGDSASRALMLTDLNSRIPVLVGEDAYHAMLVGDNSPQPVLKFLPLGQEPEIGDRIMTSGAGGILPPHLPVGVVSTVTDDVARVDLFANLASLEYVRVIDYRPPALRQTTPHDDAAARNE